MRGGTYDRPEPEPELEPEEIEAEVAAVSCAWSGQSI
jgi:hypothetical protein